jgi:hypothetical protein
VAFVLDKVFHGLGDFIVQNVFARLDAGTVETAHEGSVSSGELGIFAVLEGFNKYGAAVSFDHDHDVLMAGLGASGEFPCLVGEDVVSGVVHFGVDVVLLSAMESGRVEFLERVLWFGVVNIFWVWLSCPFGVSTVSG